MSLDFYHVNEQLTKEGTIEIYPDFAVVRSKDLMVRGNSFYAIWDEDKGLWSTSEYDVQRLVDEDLFRHKELIEKRIDGRVKVKLMKNFSSGVWKNFISYMKHLSDSSSQLDTSLIFSNTKSKKSDFASRRLPYPLAAGDTSAWEEIISTLYDPEEREKLEWAIGAIVAGDAKTIQKFLVLYGPPGSGKGTIINIIVKLFQGYYTTFEAKALGSNNNSFATEAFKNNPLVAIQHDGDLSKIEDNTLLNSIISHEEIRVNEKFKPSYDAIVNAFLFMGTNKPVKISDAKSGILRRLIDVVPSGRKLSPRRYEALMSQIDFELGAIAAHCLKVYRELGRNHYNGYRPVEMMLQTDVFYNYIEMNYDVFKEQDGVSLTQAYSLYKRFCEETLIEYKLPQYKFREELRNYFAEFDERAVVDGVRVRSWYSGFLTDKFKLQMPEEAASSLSMEETTSIFDELAATWPAQYANEDENPQKAWDKVGTTLADLDTSLLHYVRTPENHIVIDFDLKDENGEKSAELNIAAASLWPSTYSEYSKGGGGVHLHYDFDGDVSTLSRIYSEGIEIKVFTGKSALRRRFSKGNNIPVAVINSGLPLKEKKVINSDQVKSEQKLRELIGRNMRKEIHQGTKSSMDFIHKILEDAYQTDLAYDLSDLKSPLTAFAANSSNNVLYCLTLVGKLKLQSKNSPTEVAEDNGGYLPQIKAAEDQKLTFFDVEVFPNLFVICWKLEDHPEVVAMVNPKPHEVEALFKYLLVGFYNRQYDNHILYAASMGFNNEQLYQLSKKLVTSVPGAKFGQAYSLSYADILDYTSKKQSLKKYEIELRIPHMESNLDWDEPVPKELWDKVVEYCRNDVRATEAVHKARIQDFVARQILAALSGLTVNDPTLAHTAKIIFEGNRKPQSAFVYTDLSKMFPGYEYSFGKSTYKGEEVGEGGLVRAKPGMYTNVALLDVESMHPTSIHLLNMFGDDYTNNFWQLVRARLAIKKGDYDTARKLLDGKLAPYLKSEDDAKALSDALKIVINIVYGVTSASFDNPFRDPRNKDNIVAKRGALFMVDLMEAVDNYVGKNGEKWTVVHTKTDSVKIPDATPEIIEFVMQFGKKYGYNFEHEATYEKFCLVNDAVYIAKTQATEKKPSYWVATGKQFQQPYVFKTLFSKDPIEFEDLCETKSVSTALYLDFNPEVEEAEKKRQFIGKVGLFTPVISGGGELQRRAKPAEDGTPGKFAAATGAKGHLWQESHLVKERENIDMAYFNKQVDEAVTNISQYGDFEWFVS
jgi:hypothetical protein